MAIETQGYVYFLHAPGAKRIKIGYSAKHPDIRLKGLRAASPVPLVRLGFMWGTPRLERELHVKFRELRTHREWFRDDAELVVFVACNAEPWRMVVPTSWDDRPGVWVETNARHILGFEWLKRYMGKPRRVEMPHHDFVEMHLDRVIEAISDDPFWHADRADRCMYLPATVAIP